MSNTLPKMAVVSVKVDRALKEKMRRFSNVNWSETIREAIRRAVAEEELKGRRVDPDEVREASRLTDSIRRAAEGWNSTEEIRMWREARKQSSSTPRSS